MNFPHTFRYGMEPYSIIVSETKIACITFVKFTIIVKYRKKQYHRVIRFENIASQFSVIAISNTLVSNGWSAHQISMLVTYFFPLNLNASTNDNKKHFPLMISNQQN